MAYELFPFVSLHHFIALMNAYLTDSVNFSEIKLIHANKHFKSAAHDPVDISLTTLYIITLCIHYINILSMVQTELKMRLQGLHLPLRNFLCKSKCIAAAYVARLSYQLPINLRR